MTKSAAAVLALGLLCGCTGARAPGGGSEKDAGEDARWATDAAQLDPAHSKALTLRFAPEEIAPESDPGLDQLGFFQLQVFARPDPPSGAAASAFALHEEVLPHDFESGGRIALSEIPTLTVRVPDSFPAVFVRALFLDHASPAALSARGLDWGTWFGGVDASNGFVQNAELTPVPLDASPATDHVVPLFALRRVEVTVTTSARLVGDGEGALSVAASRVEALPPRAATFGYGIKPCVDLKRGPVVIDIGVLGSGMFFIAGFFDDLGITTPGQIPPGTLLSARDVNYDTGSATLDPLVLRADQYSAALSIDLGLVTPLPGNAAPGPNSCHDLGFVDAGAAGE